MNAFLNTCAQQGKVQKEELDFWRAAGEQRPEREDEGAGRNLPRFLPAARKVRSRVRSSDRPT